MVREEPKAETEAHFTSIPGRDDTAKLIAVLGVAVRRQAHHLVLVAKPPEPQVLADGRVAKPERVRESHRAVPLQTLALAGCPPRACELAPTVHRKHRSLIERR